jgi:ABC-2 type transport system ATP-binding protein
VIVETTDLTKLYGSTAALIGVSLRVTKGSVYGLVGRNGAGKTTLLGVLAGLRRPSSGSVHVGVAVEERAVLPDTPEFEPWLSGREVVDLARHLTAPETPATRVDEVLHLAGLAEDSERKVGGYSRGMLQRLGLAATVVGRPRLLLLDEPSSALDPVGRRQVLDLVARLWGEATVVFSSHVLADVQEVCDTVGILDRGRLRFQGNLHELLVGRAVPAIRVRLRPPFDDVIEALRAQPWVTAVDRPAPDELRMQVDSLEAAERGLAGALATAGARVVSVGPEEVTLEQVFLELTT